MDARNYLLLHVDDPAESAAFYAGLLGLEPVEQSETIALFALPGGLTLGLWSRHTVVPEAGGAPGCAELGLAVASATIVDATHDAWVARGVLILQPPTTMDFGRSFTAADPDGHRVRVFALA